MVTADDLQRWIGGRASWAMAQGNALALLQRMPTGSVHAVITDPPYSSGGAFRSDRSQATVAKYVRSEARDRAAPDFAGDNRDHRGFVAWFGIWAEEARRVVRDDGLLLVFTDWRQLPATSDAIQCGGWIWRGILPWVKPHGRPSPLFRSQCEFVLWATKGPLPATNGPVSPIVLPGFYSVPHVATGRVHQAEKPVDLMRALCRCVPFGGVVLDPFAGSGATLAGAVAEGRRALGFELQAEHYGSAVARMRAVAARQPVATPSAKPAEIVPRSAAGAAPSRAEAHAMPPAPPGACGSFLAPTNGRG